MRKHWTRLLSGFLCLVMAFTLLPMQALADEYAARTEQTEQQAAQPVNPFTDVKESDWFYDAVLYAYANGFFSGTSATTYEPTASMTRAMFVTVLGRMAGIDPADYAGSTGFDDVPEGAWYAPYVKWAVQFGITLGTGDDLFSPTAEINRAQMAVFFVRYFETFDVAYETGAEITTTPADLDSVPDYAKDAVMKLWRQGLLNGDGENFAPLDQASRAQVATLSQRVDKAVDTWYSEPGVPSQRESVDPDAAQQPEEEKPIIPGGISNIPVSKQEYTITLNMPDGGTDTMKQTSSTLNLDALSTPKQDGYYFLGWYYDAAYTRQVLDGDTLTAGNTALYAKMIKSGEIETSETPYFTVKTDVADSFTVTVNSSDPTADLTDQIALSGPEQYVDDETDEMKVLVVTRSADGTTYTISGPNSKLVAGGSYCVTLENDALSFAGVEETSIREYHFTVEQGEPVMNLHLKETVKEISINAISNGAQIAGQNLSPVTVQAGESGGVTTNTGDSGTFTYDGELNIGDTVAIYEGSKPSERGAESEDMGNVSYVTITGKNGTEYTYTAATTEEVLFIPDVLPIQSSWDTDTTDGAVLTVTESNLTATMSEVEAESLDKGDFLVIYEGESMEAATSFTYGCVTGFSRSGGSYIITYESVTREEVLSSMDFSTKNNVSGEELLAGADIEEMEENIAQQAIESGFAELAAWNLAAAVSTMDLSELEDGELDLSEIDMSGLATQDLSFGTLQSASISTYAGEGGGGGSGPEVKIESVRAQISTNLDHFKGMSGVRIALEMKISIEFDAGEEEESITIELTPTFVQELKLNISSDGGAKFKWKWGFIPYFYDLYATVSVDMYTYTSINLNATISSGGEGDTVSDTKDLVEKVSGVVKDLSAIVKGENIEVTQGITDLQDLYCEMLENDTDWITLYRKNINEQNWNVATVIKIKLSIDFVVQANVNVSMGLEFDYENGKRYNYTVYIFHGKSTSNTVNLVTESYNLQLYAMGVLGIRAGVEVSLSVALITEKIAAIGIVVNVGAYLKVYGYVVYELHHVAGQKNTSKGSGALYIEVGCYLDIGMDLTAFGGKLSWKPTLYANEWPLWTAGSTLAVSGFAATQQDEDDEDGEDPEIPMAYMRKGQTAINVPDELLTMAGFDMRTGADAEQKYDVSLFDISFSDSRFSMKNGKITLDFGNGITWQTAPMRELECDMTITWKGAPLSFNTETIQIKTKVHWDQYEEYSYAIFDVQGADKKIATMKLKSTDTLTIPEMTDDDHPGYYFRGWTVERVLPDGTLETLDVTGNTVAMLGYDLRLTANWEHKTDIQYWIQPMFQQLDGTYVKGELYDVHDGQVDIEFAPTLTEFVGYVTPDIGNRHRIKADGTSVIIAHYPIQQYSFVRYLYENGSFISGAYRYGETIDWTPPTRDGYTFAGWKVEKADGTELDILPQTMRAYELIATATWTCNTDTPFTVYTYTQNEDGSYTLKDTLTYTGTTDSVAKTSVAYDGTPGDSTFDLPTYDGYTLRNNCRSITITIKGDGTSYENYYYNLNRNTLTVTHVFSSGKRAEDELLNCVGPTVPDPEMTFAGYTLAGYYTDESCTTEATYPTVLNADATIYAKWTANTVSYTVEHYQQNTDDTYPDTPTDTETLTGSVDQVVTPNRKNYNGFTAPEGTDFTLTATAENNVIRYEYTRAFYGLTLELNGGSLATSGGTNVRYGDAVEPATPTRSGYTFGGWYTDADCTEENKLTDGYTMPVGGLILYAKWTANTDTAYTVEHYQQNAAGANYTKVDTENKTGTTGELTAAAAKTYTGFTAQAITQETIQGNGTTVVKVYYDRETFTLTYDLNAGTDASAALATGASTTAEYRHGASVTVPSASRSGYSFDGWYTDSGCITRFDNTMPMESITLYAKWTAGNVNYTVNHYQQNVDGTYPDTPTYTETLSGKVGDTVTPNRKSYTGFGAPNGTEFTLTATAENNVIRYEYTRTQYQLSYSGLDGVTFSGTAPTGRDVYYGAAVTAPDMSGATKDGYTFGGWYTDSAYTEANKLTDGTTMPAGSLTLYAKWTANSNTVYTVEHYQQNAEGVGYTKVEADTESKTGTTDTQTAAEAKSYTGFTAQTITQETIQGNGNTVVKVYYTRQTFTLTYDLQDDSATLNGTSGQSYRHGATVTTPDPTTTRAGYTFEGWFTDSGCTKAFDNTMPMASTTLYAKWVAGNVSYTVKYYLQGLDGSYPEEPYETFTGSGNVDQVVTPKPKAYSGFTTPEEKNFTLTATAENNVIEYKYVRNKYALDYSIDNDVTFTNGATAPTGGQIYYGATVTAPDMTNAVKTGYTFGGWYTDESCNTALAAGATMPVGGLTLYAKWTANTDTAYTVKHYQQNANDNNYVEVEGATNRKYGTTGELTAAAAKSYNGFTAQAITQKTIAADGSTVVEVYYDRVEYQLTYVLNHDTATMTGNTVQSYRYGATVNTPTPTVTNGDQFMGWYTDADCTKKFDGTMPMENTTLYAKWSLYTSYTVNYYLQNLDGSTYSATADTIYGNGYVGDKVKQQPKVYSGFKTPDPQTITLVATSSENVVNYYYTRNTYMLVYSIGADVTFTNGATAPTDGAVYYGATVTAPDMTNAVKTGYIFKGWYTDSNFKTKLAADATMPVDGLNLYAKWEPITYTLRFDPLGNLPVKTWLLAQEGAEETVPIINEYGNYENVNSYGMPYIDIPMTYGDTFYLPTSDTTVMVNGGIYNISADCGMTSVSYGGGYNSETSQYEAPTTVAPGDFIRNATTTDGDIVEVTINWPYMNFSWDRLSTAENPAKIYNVYQLWTVFAVAENDSYPYSELMVDLEVSTQDALAGITQGVGDGCFDGNGHTIKALNAANPDSGRMGTLDRKRKDNFTIKNVTLEGFTVTYAHYTEGNYNYYGYYGGLFGEVGDNFTLENVTVKDLTMDLTLNGGLWEYQQHVERDCIGGLIGYAAGTVTLKNCTVTGTTMNVTLSEDNTTAAVGSLIGYVAGGESAVTIENCTFDPVSGISNYGYVAASSTTEGDTETDEGSDPADIVDSGAVD